MQASDANDIDGTWEPVEATMAGAPFPVAAFAGAVLTLRGGEYSFGIDQGKCRIVAAGLPGQLDITGVQGPNSGRTIPALYQRDADDLRVCYQLGAGGERPARLEAPPGTQQLLIRYRRVGS